jgi:ABC-type multidrug transport system fused ATPase/permease subunit
MKAYSQSAGYAEQALQAIKVVHTYGNELLEVRNYNNYLGRASKATESVTFRVAAGNAILFGVIFGFYAYAFFWGGYLRYNDVKNGDVVYTGGAIISCMFCVVFSSF